MRNDHIFFTCDKEGWYFHFHTLKVFCDFPIALEIAVVIYAAAKACVFKLRHDVIEVIRC